MISISRIQSILNELGYDAGPVDGIRGRKTTAAIIEFQRDNKLSPDGVVGPITATALSNAVSEKSSNRGIDNSVRNIVKGNGRNIRSIAIHCTATREGQDVSANTIRSWHTNPRSKGGRGWSDIGYHFVIRLGGKIELGRDERLTGAHVAGFNTGSIGVVYVGGVDKNGKPKDTRTEQQKKSMLFLVKQLVRAYPKAEVKGHRDFSPDLNKDGKIQPNEWMKACPSFDAVKWWQEVND